MYDVIIVGGNLVGASCALYLAKLRPDFKIGLIEAQEINFIEDETLDSRVYAISPKNYRILRELNAWTNAKYTSQIVQMDVSGDTSGKINLDAIEARCGYLAKVVESRRLLQAIYAQIVLLDNVEIINTRLSKLEVGAGVSRLFAEQNKIYECSLCVAADGSNSFIRKQLNIVIEKIPYNQSGVVANFACELPHNEIAFQWFLSGGDILAYLPLFDKQISIVWSTNNPERLMKLNSSEFSHEVAMASGFKLGQLKMITPPCAFPLGLTLVESVYSNGVVFIGDSAHTIHPLAGQGVNLGFADAWLLADILSKYKKYQLSDVVILGKYHSQRISKIREMQLVCHGLYGLFNSNRQQLSFIRNIGLNIINKSGWIKNKLIKMVVAN